MTDLRLARAILPLLLLAFAPLAARAQPTDAVEPGRLRVFLDCALLCDQDFLRTEMDYVDWVRDRKDAQVHVLVTSERTGSGGERYTMDFIGVREFTGRSDTLIYNAAAAETNDAKRHGLIHQLRVGLVPFLARTSIADKLVISVEKPDPGNANAAAAKPTRDPWDYWVFKISGNGFMNGEEQSLSRNLYGSISANRTTDEWKLSVSLNGSEYLSRFDVDSTTIENKRHNFSGRVLNVKSISDHFSVGVRGEAERSSYSNYDLLATAAPAVEYSLYPYRESTRRLFTVLYAIGVSRADYAEETIFFRTSETLATQSLTANFEVTQPWGSVNLEVEGSNYLKDARLNRLEVGGATSIRLFKGFSFNVGGNYSRIRDQLSLPRSGASRDDVLLQRRQLQTGYEFFTFFGLSYSFGSIFNNIVNPRFGNSGGGGITISM